jgi:hypothetical protein
MVGRPPTQVRPKLDTSGSLLVLDHYRELGLIYGWDRSRMERLCKLLNITPFELGRLCCVFSSVKFGKRPDHRLMRAYISENNFPPAVALHFAILESFALEYRAKLRNEEFEPKPVMPIDLLFQPKES